MWNRVLTAAFLAPWIFCCLPAGLAMSDDQEGCLFCHGLGLVVRAGQEVRYIGVGEHPGSAHASLYCSDCHPDAKVVPHPARPNPASCVGECHGVTPSARDTHRRASVGAGVEAHRKASFPRGPCLLCHGGADRAGDKAAADARCRGCHGEKEADIRRGVHARVFSVPAANRCAACHPPHRGSAGAAAPSCDGPACHAKVSPRMLRLAGHEKGAGSPISVRKGGRIGTFLGIAFLGWLVGGRMSRSTGRGENP